MVVATLKFFTSFCAFWDLLVIFIEKGVFCKAVFLVTSVGRNCCSCGINFLPAFVLTGISLFIFKSGRKVGGSTGKIAPSPGSTTDNEILLGTN